MFLHKFYMHFTVTNMLIRWHWYSKQLTVSLDDGMKENKCARGYYQSAVFLADTNRNIQYFITSLSSNFYLTSCVQ